MSVCLFALSACGEDSRRATQPQGLAKSIFTEGPAWYLQQSVVSAGAGPRTGTQLTADKIRWEIEVDRLIALRSYASVIGADEAPPVVASFPIVSHEGADPEVPWHAQPRVVVDWRVELPEGVEPVSAQRAELRVGELQAEAWVDFREDEAAALSRAAYLELDTAVRDDSGEWLLRTAFWQREAPPYTPMAYAPSMAEHFGFARVSRPLDDPARGPSDFAAQQLARWNLIEGPGQARPIRLVASPELSERALELQGAVDALAGWNQALHDAMSAQVFDEDLSLITLAPNRCHRDAAVERVRSHPRYASLLEALDAPLVELCRDIESIDRLDTTLLPEERFHYERSGDPRYSLLRLEPGVRAERRLGETQRLVDPESGEIVHTHSQIYLPEIRAVGALMADLNDLLCHDEETHALVHHLYGDAAEADRVRTAVEHACTNRLSLEQIANGDYLREAAQQSGARAAPGVAGAATPLWPASTALSNSLMRQLMLRAHQSSEALLTREALVEQLERQLFEGAVQHELGHVLGLRDNLAGSSDEENFPEEYWAVLDEFPNLHLCEFADADQDGVVTDGEQGACELTGAQFERFREERREREAQQRRQGIELHRYASVMDLGTHLHLGTAAPPGRYDHAAIKLAYGGLRESYDGVPNPLRSNRVDAPAYVGGDICREDADCPHTDRGQHCGHEPDFGSIWRRGPDPERGYGECSDWDLDQVLGNVQAPGYLYCGPDQRGEHPRCHPGDSGVRVEQIVRETTARYDSRYVFRSFRRHRAGFSEEAYADWVRSEYFEGLARVVPALLKGLYDPGFIFRDGAGGYADLHDAAAEAFEFFVRVVSQPRASAYRYDAGAERFRGVSGDCDPQEEEAGTCFELGLDQGRHFGSRYVDYAPDDGLLVRAGHHIDIGLALEALTSDSTAGVVSAGFFGLFPEALLGIVAGTLALDASAFAWRTPATPPRFERAGYLGLPTNSLRSPAIAMDTAPLEVPYLQFVSGDWVDNLLSAVTLGGAEFYQPHFRMSAFPRTQAEPPEDPVFVSYRMPHTGTLYVAEVVEDREGVEVGVASRVLLGIQEAADALVRLEALDVADDDLLDAPHCAAFSVIDDAERCLERLISLRTRELAERERAIEDYADRLAAHGLLD